jgi:hypothetical protein
MAGRRQKAAKHERTVSGKRPRGSSETTDQATRKKPPLKEYLDQQSDELDEAVTQALALWAATRCAVLRTAIIANTFLIEENEKLQAQISTGFDRSRTSKAAPAEGG